jgi:hypothetical protein
MSHLYIVDEMIYIREDIPNEYLFSQVQNVKEVDKIFVYFNHIQSELIVKG